MMNAIIHARRSLNFALRAVCLRYRLWTNTWVISTHVCHILQLVLPLSIGYLTFKANSQSYVPSATLPSTIGPRHQLDPLICNCR